MPATVPYSTCQGQLWTATAWGPNSKNRVRRRLMPDESELTRAIYKCGVMHIEMNDGNIIQGADRDAPDARSGHQSRFYFSPHRAIEHPRETC